MKFTINSSKTMKTLIYQQIVKNSINHNLAKYWINLTGYFTYFRKFYQRRKVCQICDFFKKIFDILFLEKKC